MPNLFSDFPERVDELKKYQNIPKLVGPLEDAFGEKDFYKSTDEAMEFYFGVLDAVGKFCATEIQPTARRIDAQGAVFKDGVVILPDDLLRHVNRVAELGFFHAPVPRYLGGINVPRAVQCIALEMLGHACPNTALTLAAFSMTDFLLECGTEEQIKHYVPLMLENKCHTSMALTEPGAGSDLTKLRTSGTKQGDHWIVNGAKQFITNGDSDITFALVRTDPKGFGSLTGLSVLIVPREINGKQNTRVSKIEDKICLHASPTCELIFENSIGYMLGKEGDGFKVMLELMNMARLAVASLALGVATAAMDEARNYARTRVTMGKPIIQHPMVADIIHEMDIELRAIRAMTVEAAMASDMLRIARHNKDEVAIQKWKRRYRRLTPLCKYLASERCVSITRSALQLFGGYGVCKDYNAERYLREALIFPIYEGTSQIQSLLVLKDTMKDVATHATGFLGSLAGAWAESKVTRDPIKAALLQGRNELNQGIKTILGSVIKQKFKGDIEALSEKRIQEFFKEFSFSLLTEKTDLTFPLLCAERFMRITADYYAMKCMADHCPPGDKEREKWILEYANLALPRMRMENHYMVNRLPSTIPYIQEEINAAKQTG